MLSLSISVLMAIYWHFDSFFPVQFRGGGGKMLFLYSLLLSKRKILKIGLFLSRVLAMVSFIYHITTDIIEGSRSWIRHTLHGVDTSSITVANLQLSRRNVCITAFGMLFSTKVTPI